jgi:hypothetical protein
MPTNKQGLYRNYALIVFVALVAFLSNRSLFKLPEASTFILKDIGITNNINQLRGEDGMTFLGRLMHNKSAFLYKYIENSVSVADFPQIVNSLGFVATALFLLGLFFALRNKNRRLIWLIFYIVAVGLFGGLYRQFSLATILLIPPVAILAVYGIAKIKTSLLFKGILAAGLMIEMLLKAFI